MSKNKERWKSYLHGWPWTVFVTNCEGDMREINNVIEVETLRPKVDGCRYRVSFFEGSESWYLDTRTCKTITSRIRLRQIYTGWSHVSEYDPGNFPGLDEHGILYKLIDSLIQDEYQRIKKLVARQQREADKKCNKKVTPKI